MEISFIAVYELCDIGRYAIGKKRYVYILKNWVEQKTTVYTSMKDTYSSFSDILWTFHLPEIRFSDFVEFLYSRTVELYLDDSYRWIADYQLEKH